MHRSPLAAAAAVAHSRVNRWRSRPCAVAAEAHARCTACRSAADGDRAKAAARRGRSRPGSSARAVSVCRFAPAAPGLTPTRWKREPWPGASYVDRDN